MLLPPRIPALFPYTTLFRSLRRNAGILTAVLAVSLVLVFLVGPIPALAPMSIAFVAVNWREFKLTKEEIVSTAAVLVLAGGLDRKSTRLNSSHSQISYAVFC